MFFLLTLILFFLRSCTARVCVILDFRVSVSSHSSFFPYRPPPTHPRSHKQQLSKSSLFSPPLPVLSHHFAINYQNKMVNNELLCLLLTLKKKKKVRGLFGKNWGLRQMVSKKNKSAHCYISAVVAKNHCYTSRDCCCTFLAFLFVPIKERGFFCLFVFLFFFLTHRMLTHVNN